MAYRALLFVLSFIPIAVAAEPSVRLSAEVLSGGARVLFTFEQDDLGEIEGCHYNLFAADSPRDLSSLPGRGLSIATFERQEATVQIIAINLRKLSRKSLKARSVKLYYRVLIPCPEKGISELGELQSLNIPTHRRGKFPSMNRLIRRMKFHMRYAEPSDF